MKKILLAIVTILGMGSHMPLGISGSAGELDDKEKQIISQAVRETLRDPLSALFKWPPYNSVDELHPAGGLRMGYYCGLVNAKNGFGGYTGYVPYYASLAWITGGSFTADIQMIATEDPDSIMSHATLQMCSMHGYKFK